MTALPSSRSSEADNVRRRTCMSAMIAVSVPAVRAAAAQLHGQDLCKAMSPFLTAAACVASLMEQAGCL